MFSGHRHGGASSSLFLSARLPRYKAVPSVQLHVCLCSCCCSFLSPLTTDQLRKMLSTLYLVLLQFSSLCCYLLLPRGDLLVLYNSVSFLLCSGAKMNWTVSVHQLMEIYNSTVATGCRGRGWSDNRGWRGEGQDLKTPHWIRKDQEGWLQRRRLKRNIIQKHSLIKMNQFGKSWTWLEAGEQVWWGQGCRRNFPSQINNVLLFY